MVLCELSRLEVHDVARICTPITTGYDDRNCLLGRNALKYCHVKWVTTHVASHVGLSSAGYPGNNPRVICGNVLFATMDRLLDDNRLKHSIRIDSRQPDDCGRIALCEARKHRHNLSLHILEAASPPLRQCLRERS